MVSFPAISQLFKFSGIVALMFFLVIVFASLLNNIAPADAASIPSPTMMVMITDPDYWVKSSSGLVYTNELNNISWHGPRADNVSLSYIVNGKEYFITRARGDRNNYYWNVPDEPDTSQPYATVFHYVRIKAVWQKKATNSAGKSYFQNITTQYSDYFTLARPDAFVISTQSLPAATYGEQYRADLRAEGGETPYSWTIKSGILPNGLTLNDRGQIRGTPTDVRSQTITFRVNDAGVDSLSDTMDLTINIVKPGESATPTAPSPFNYDIVDVIGPIYLNRPADGYETTSIRTRVIQLSGTPMTVTMDLTGCPSGVDYAFTPRSGVCNGSFDSYLNFTASNRAAPGNYDIVVHATTATGLDKTISFTLSVSSTAASGDLILERPYGLYEHEASKAIVPMQVFNMSSYLIKGKNTIFKATIRSTFNTDKDVRVELWLPTEDWEWEGVPYGGSMDIRTEEMGTYRFPEHYIYNRTITVPANSEVEVFLPEPSELTEETIHSSPHRWMDELTIVTNAPRPRHSGGEDILDEPEYTIIVDPANRIAESDEHNNCPYHGTEWMQTYSTASLNMLLSPVISDNYEIGDFWPGGVTGDAFENDFRDNIRPQARNSSEFMLGVYPVADDKFSYYLSDGVMTFHEHGGNSNHFYMQQDMSDMAAENGYDRIVGMVPEGFGDAGWNADWLGVVFGHNPRACFVMIDRNLTAVMVHENYHNLGYDDVYGSGRVIAADDSYWVNRQLTRTVADDDLRDYMDYVIVDNSLGYPVVARPYWTSTGRFDTVMRTLPDVEDPEVLLFRSVVYKNGSVDLKPFMIVDGKPDMEPAQWNYKVVLKDAGGNVVREQKEDVAFVVNVVTVEGKQGGTMPYDMAFISSTILWSNNVTLVELQDKGGTVVASRAVSRNPPVVQFTAPEAGGAWEFGNTYKLKWAASDPDGDTLHYSLAMSPDKVAWTPVAIDIASNEYEFDTKLVQPGDYYFRVRATDGVLSSNDTMEQSIHITGDSSLLSHSGTATPTSAPGQPGLSDTAIFAGAFIVVILVAIVGIAGIIGWYILGRKK